MAKLITFLNIRMRLSVFVLLGLYAIAWNGAYAAEQELPCSAEIARYCKDVKPGGGRILSCLSEHEKELSASCKRKLEESMKRLTEAQKACTVDVEKFCKDIQPGGGRILKCLRERKQELSPACRQIIDKTGEKAQGEKQQGK